MGIPDTPADLAEHHQIGYRDPATGVLMSWQFQPLAGDRPILRMIPRNRLVVEDMSVAWSMVLRGLGVGWLPAWCGLKDLASGRIVELLRDWRIAPTAVHAVHLDRARVPHRTRGLIDVLAAQASSWDYRG